MNVLGKWVNLREVEWVSPIGTGYSYSRKTQETTLVERSEGWFFKRRWKERVPVQERGWEYSFNIKFKGGETVYIGREEVLWGS